MENGQKLGIALQNRIRWNVQEQILQHITVHVRLDILERIAWSSEHPVPSGIEECVIKAIICD